MGENRIRSRKGKIVFIGVCVVLFVALLMAISFLSSANRVVKFGVLSVPTSSICGVCNVVQILLNVVLVLFADKSGFFLALGQTALNFASLFMTVIVRQNGAGLPGIAMTAGSLAVVIILRRYIVRLNESENALRELAMTDSLTTLPNRRAFNKLLEESVLKNEPFAVVFVDLDNFKNINDTMGHDYGNLVLVEITRRWKSVRGEEHFIARLGGDEFAMIIKGYKEKENVKSLTERYQFCLRDKFVIKNKDFYVTASMGVSFYPDNSTDASMLLRYADTAMYNAKKDGKHRISIFAASQMESVEADVDSENFLRNAVSNEKFRLVFQPLYITGTEELVCFETLIRFVDENGELVSPYKYILMAEKLNYIMDIDSWVLENSMKQFQQLLDVSPQLKMSVNVSAAFLLDMSFIPTVKRCLKQSGFPAENLVVEVTENLFISSLEKASQVLEQLKEMGVTIALDDFGTGYASLNYLSELPIDVLKIDKAFIDKMLTESSDKDFVKAIISMGHLLNCIIVSEGVETREQYKKLEAFGCDMIQGFLLSKPLPIEKAIDRVYENELKEKV